MILFKRRLLQEHRKIKNFAATLCLLSPFFAEAQTDGEPSTPSEFQNLSIAPLADKSIPLKEQLKLKLEAGEHALQMKMPSIAQHIAESALNSEFPDIEKRASAMVLDSLIAQGKYELASRRLSESDSSEEDKLRRGIIYGALGNLDKAKRILNSIDVKSLSDYGKYESFLARGYILFDESKYTEAYAEFKKARSLSLGSHIFPDAEIASYMCLLAQDLPAGDLEKYSEELAEKNRFYFGTSIGFRFAKQYAVSLYRLGKNEDALELIDDYLQVKLADDIDKDELRIVKAAISNSDDIRYEILEDVLSRTSSAAIVDFTIAVIQKDRAQNPEKTLKFLSKLVASPKTPLRDVFLLEYALSSLDAGNADEAAKNALKIVEEFPSSKYVSEALRVLAWSAFYSSKDKTPEYRLAASNLMALSKIEKDPLAAAKSKMLAADCYFLNKDFDTAAEIYLELINSHAIKSLTLLNRALQTFIIQGEAGFEKAETVLNNAYDSENFDADEIWNAEWLFISNLRKKIGAEAALERIEKSMKKAATRKDGKAIAIRLLWLKANMVQGLENYDLTISLCDEILKKSKELPADEIPDALAANTLLMKAKALEFSDKNSDGENYLKAEKTYEFLRNTYPSSDAAALSYIYQARSLAAKGQFLEAQSLCLELAKTESPYAYSAKFDAALYARKIGLDGNYREAIALLEKLRSDFPDNPRNFYAQMEQAEILRLLNRFSEARALYGDIVRRYPEHPEIYLAYIGLGDSTMVQKGKELDAAAIFERIYALPQIPLDVKAEAAFKWSFAVEKSGGEREANEIRWLTSNNLTGELDTENEQNIISKYWTARILFELAKFMESEGRKSEARTVYEIVASKNLPGADIAKSKLKKNE